MISSPYHPTKPPCTVIFDISTLTWTKIQEDSRLAGPGGQLLAFANDTRILYLGGFDNNGNKLRAVYELVNNNHWMLWSQKLLLPIANDTIIKLDPKFGTNCNPPSIPLGIYI